MFPFNSALFGLAIIITVKMIWNLEAVLAILDCPLPSPVKFRRLPLNTISFILGIKNKYYGSS